MKRRLVVRADAHKSIGSGHVMRMIGLAQGWKSCGGDVIFVSRLSAPWLADRLRKEGFAFVEPTNIHPAKEDVKTLIQMTSENDRIVLDGYHFDGEYMRTLRRAGRFTIVMDDVSDRNDYPATVVINQNADAEQYDYALEPETLLLLGPRYALLRNEFVASSCPRSPIPKTAINILVSFGGGDVGNMTTKALVALQDTGLVHLHVKVVLGPFVKQSEEVAELVDTMPCRCDLLNDVKNMAALMKWADLCIGAAGSTCWELCYYGVPMVIGATAKNQRGIASSLHRKGAAERFGDTIHPSLLANLIEDVDRRNRMSEAGRCLVDGQGRDRVANIKYVLFLGYGEEDTRLIEDLRNAGCVVHHSTGRMASFSPYDIVISYGYRHIIPKRLIDQGVPIINLHTSLLPYNRGAHPNFWAFYDDTPKGVTVHLIDEGVDTGPIIAQREVVFDQSEKSFVDTYVRLRKEMEDLFLDNMQIILAGEYTPIPQVGKGTYHELADLPEIRGGWSADISETLAYLKEGHQSDSDSDVLGECRRCIIHNKYQTRPDCDRKSEMGQRMGCKYYCDMHLRLATMDDSAILLEWRNDENTRNKSFNSDLIDPVSHHNWLKNKLVDSDSTLLIAEVDGQPIGQIRFDLISDEVVISLSVASNKAGKGAGFMMICNGCSRAITLFPNKTIVAMVRDDNHASKRVFTKAGFVVAEQTLDEYGFFLRFELRVTNDYK